MKTGTKVLLVILALAILVGAIFFIRKTQMKNMIKEILSYDNKPSTVNPGQFIAINTTEAELQKLSWSELRKKLNAIKAM